MLSDGALIWKVFSSHNFIDDNDWIGGFGIGLRESTALLQAGSNGLEITWRNLPVIHGDPFRFFASRNPHSIVSTAFQRQSRRDDAGGGHSGQPFDPLLDGAIESHDFWCGVVFRSGKPKLHGQNVMRIE